MVFGHPQEIIGNLIKAGEIPEIIAVFPNERVREDDRRNPPDVFSLQHFQAFDRFLIDLEQNLMPFMKCRFQVRGGREHTAIAGFSMGGREALLSVSKTRTVWIYWCVQPGIWIVSLYKQWSHGRRIDSGR